MSILHNKLLFLSKCRISCQIVEVFLDFCGFNFADFWFNPIYTSILFSSTLILLSNLHLSGFCFACFFMSPHINSVNPGMPVCKYDLRMFLAPGAASLPALVRFVGPGVQWQSAARLWGLGVLLLFSLVVGSAHKYQSDQYLPFVSQAKLEVSYAI